MDSPSVGAFFRFFVDFRGSSLGAERRTQGRRPPGPGAGRSEARVPAKFPVRYGLTLTPEFPEEPFFMRCSRIRPHKTTDYEPDPLRRKRRTQSRKPWIYDVSNFHIYKASTIRQRFSAPCQLSESVAACREVPLFVWKQSSVPVRLTALGRVIGVRMLQAQRQFAELNRGVTHNRTDPRYSDRFHVASYQSAKIPDPITKPCVIPLTHQVRNIHVAVVQLTAPTDSEPQESLKGVLPKYRHVSDIEFPKDLALYAISCVSLLASETRSCPPAATDPHIRFNAKSFSSDNNDRLSSV